jgi:hypothetical protein
MSKRESASTVSRRGVLKAASLVGATAVASPVDVKAQVPRSLARPGRSRHRQIPQPKEVIISKSL